MIESTIAGKLVLARARERYAPKLLADIGGTNARFAVEVAPGIVEAVAVLPCASYATPEQALRDYLASEAARDAGAEAIKEGALAIAGNVSGDHVQMTNHHLRFSPAAIRREFGWHALTLCNDFAALALSIPRLSDAERRQVGGGEPMPDGAMAVLGPGTGFGVSAMVKTQEGWTPLETEGGHVNFAPANETECRILEFAWREYTHVSVERLLSGIGLDIVYRALCEQAGVAVSVVGVPEIMRRGLALECPICSATLDAFCSMLGTAAANVALTLGASGGVYIGGGIVPRLGSRFDASGFRTRFEAKGRFSAYLAQIPTYLITADYPAFKGLSAKLAMAAYQGNE
jgi:glucokinase